MKRLREDLRLAGLLFRCLFPVSKDRLPPMPLYVASAVLFTLGLAYFGVASREPRESGARHPFETAPTALVASPKDSPGDSGLDMVRSVPLPEATSLPPPEPAPAAPPPPRPPDTDWSKTLTLAKEPPPAPVERPAFRLVTMPAPPSSKATSSVVLKPARTEVQQVSAAPPAAAAVRSRPPHRTRQYRDRKGRYYDR